jgi:ATP-binding cassette subfamily B protein
MSKPNQRTITPNSNKKFFQYIAKYKAKIGILLALALVSNGLGLLIPKLIGNFIDQYSKTGFVDWYGIGWVLGGLAVVVMIFTIIQSAVSSYLAEDVGFDLRQKLSHKLSRQTNSYVTEQTPSKLLTVLTSDVDGVKGIVSQGVVTAFSAILILIGSIILLVQINWQLALMVLTIIPLVVVTFGAIFGKIGGLFRQAQQNLEKINRVINESIVAASLVRVLNSQKSESKKFDVVNQASKKINLGIVNLFSTLIPVVNLLSNLATLAIIYFGGRLVIEKQISLGDFSAFLSYLSLLITPIFLLSFISSGLSRALISFGRIDEVLSSEVVEPAGKLVLDLKGAVEFKNIKLELAGRQILKDISFKIKAGTRTAILGPTAAGKSQLFSLLAGLNLPTSGEILIDNNLIQDLEPGSFYAQVGLVFQDSVIFNTSLRENILFQNNDEISEAEQQSILDKAVKVSALDDLVESLPQGMDTLISERGTNLSGGQKQRLMLARALALNPKLLLLDDFTARVDISTERLILGRLKENYPDVTLISITQKIEPIKDYDQILVLMEGELLASGKHDYLLENCLEYKQIWESQQGSEG